MSKPTWDDFKHTKRTKHRCKGMEYGLGDPDDLLLDPEDKMVFIASESGRRIMCRYCPLCGATLPPR